MQWERLALHLHSKSPNVRRSAMRMLLGLGVRAEPAIYSLIATYEENDDYLKKEAIKVIGKIGSKASPAIPILVTALVNKNAGIRKEAAIALGNMRNEALVALPELLAIAENGDIIPVWEAVVEALGKIGCETAIPILIKEIESGTEIKEKAAWALGVMGAKAIAALPALNDAFIVDDHHSKLNLDWARRRIVNEVMRKNREAGIISIELFQVFVVGDPLLKFKVAKTIEKIKVCSVATLKEALANPDSDIREYAVWVAGNMLLAEVGTLLCQALQDPDHGVRRYARQALKKLCVKQGDFEYSHLKQETMRLRNILVELSSGPLADHYTTNTSLIRFVRDNVCSESSDDKLRFLPEELVSSPITKWENLKERYLKQVEQLPAWKKKIATGRRFSRFSHLKKTGLIIEAQSLDLSISKGRLEAELYERKDTVPPSSPAEKPREKKKLSTKRDRKQISVVRYFGESPNFWRKCRERFFLMWHWISHKIRQKHWFEQFLGEEAGRPGPIERAVAQSIWLMQVIQLTIGLKFVLLANVMDKIIEMVTGYVQGLFQAWKLSRTIHKKLRRMQHNSQVKEMSEDLVYCRFQLSRLFSFAGFSVEDFASGTSLLNKWEKITQPTFALKLVLEIRGHLDEMKRDLSFLTSKQIAETVKKSAGDFLKSLIPNPLELFSNWKDVMLISFFMNYSRRDIEKMYAEMLVCYGKLLTRLSEDKSDFVPSLAKHEKTIIQSANNDCSDCLEVLIEKNRFNLQRFIQMLCNCNRFVYVKYWTKFDLLQELAKTESLRELHISCELELERWLTAQVAKALQIKGRQMNAMEKKKRFREAKDFRRRYRFHQYLSKHF